MYPGTKIREIISSCIVDLNFLLKSQFFDLPVMSEEKIRRTTKKFQVFKNWDTIAEMVSDHIVVIPIFLFRMLKVLFFTNNNKNNKWFTEETRGFIFPIYRHEETNNLVLNFQKTKSKYDVCKKLAQKVWSTKKLPKIICFVAILNKFVKYPLENQKKFWNISEQRVRNFVLSI